MKHILPFVLFEAKAESLHSGLTKKQEGFLNRYTQGTWSVNPTTGLVDVQGNFDCSDKRLKSLSGISFGHVDGNFHCIHNQLTSLAGAPQTVDGDFWCYENQLTSLAGAPQTVDGDFSCSYNQLTSLAGAPQKVSGNFSCAGNQLTSLAGAPQTVDGDFTCNEFQLGTGEWNMEGWVGVLNTGTSAAQKLISTLPWLQPDWWNSELQRDPGKTVHLLSTMWKHMPKDMQSPIKIPRGYEDDFELFSGFDELGLF